MKRTIAILSYTLMFSLVAFSQMPTQLKAQIATACSDCCKGDCDGCCKGDCAGGTCKHCGHCDHCNHAG
jgi:hypothetical protein